MAFSAGRFTSLGDLLNGGYPVLVDDDGTIFTSLSLPTSTILKDESDGVNTISHTVSQNYSCINNNSAETSTSSINNFPSKDTYTAADTNVKEATTSLTTDAQGFIKLNFFNENVDVQTCVRSTGEQSYQNDVLDVKFANDDSNSEDIILKYNNGKCNVIPVPILINGPIPRVLLPNTERDNIGQTSSNPHCGDSFYAGSTFDLLNNSLFDDSSNGTIQDSSSVPVTKKLDSIKCSDNNTGSDSTFNTMYLTVVNNDRNITQKNRINVDKDTLNSNKMVKTCHGDTLVKVGLPIVTKKQFPCSEHGCNKTFTSRWGQRCHSRSHANIRLHTCAEENCGKSFIKSSDLLRHNRSHTGEQAYTCMYSDCGRKFSTAGNRNVHILTHSNVRKFTCNVTGCGQAFTTFSSLTRHSGVHTGARLYCCSVDGCYKRFSEQSSLRRHRVVHMPTGTKPHLCDVCGRGYKHISTLKQHKLTAHTDSFLSELKTE